MNQPQQYGNQLFKYSYSYKAVEDQNQIKQKNISPQDIILLKPNICNAICERYCYMTLQLLVNAAFWGGLYLILCQPIYLLGLAIWLLLIGFIFSWVFYNLSSTKKYLLNVKSIDEIKVYAEKMKVTNPLIQYNTYSYHQTRSGKHTHTHITWRNTANLGYQTCVDITPDISEILTKCNLVRFDTKLIWSAGNIITTENWRKLGEFELSIAHRHDVHVCQRDTSNIPGQFGAILAYSGSKPCLLTVSLHCLMTFLQIGIIYEIIFHFLTGHFTYNVQKIISQNQGILLEMPNQQFSNLNDPGQLNVFNQINFNQQQPIGQPIYNLNQAVIPLNNLNQQPMQQQQGYLQQMQPFTDSQYQQLQNTQAQQSLLYPMQNQENTNFSDNVNGINNQAYKSGQAQNNYQAKPYDQNIQAKL